MGKCRTLSTFLISLVCLAVAACASAPPLAVNPGEAPEYQLAPNDRLQISVFGEETLSKEYVVTSAGDIAFPLLGDLPAAGKTGSELSTIIAAKLAEGYLNDPRVSIEVLNYRPFYILGEVQRSGEFAYKPELTALQAVALAGGFTYRADKDQVFIRRSGADQELTYKLNTGKPVFVMPGDTIRVGERFF